MRHTCTHRQAEKKGGILSKVKVAIAGGYAPPMDTSGVQAIQALNLWVDAEDIAGSGGGGGGGSGFDLDEGKHHLGFPFLYW
jgi:hypothetical protein